MAAAPAFDAALERARAAFANGDVLAAFASAGEALTHTPQSQEARVLRINAALTLERWQDAIAALEPLASNQPPGSKLHKTLATCWLRIGNASKAQHRVDAALAAYRRCLAADPQNHDARFNLGVLLIESGKPADAIAPLREIAGASDVPAAFKLAEAQIASGNTSAAEALLTDLAPRLTTREHRRQCSKLLLEASPEKAKTLARQLIDEEPQAVAWAIEFSRQLRRDSDLSGSTELLAHLRERTRDAAQRLRIDLEMAQSLPSTYPDRATLEAMRREFIENIDDFVVAYPPERIAQIAPKADTLLTDNFYLAYQGENDREPQRRFGTWLAQSLQTLLPNFKPAPEKRARPRLAMVSSRFHECTVGSYFASWVEHLATTGWELILAHVGDYRDTLTERLAAHAHGELTLAGDIVENSTKLHAVGADLILYPELGMDYRTLGLAALRLAPVQACAWGHPVTTGLPTIDTFVSCAEMEPTDAAEHYTERLLTLPGLGTRYLSPEIPTPVSREALGLPEHGALYLVPQSMFKLHPDNDRVFAEIVREDPDAKLVFFTGVEPGALRAFRARLSREFDVDKHAVFLPMRSRTDYLHVNLACDVMLDSLHWSGGNTTLDALHARLPVVTSPGLYMRGRQSMAMLKHLDCGGLIAESPQQLARLAIDVAHDRTRRHAYAQRIDANLSGLTQSDAPLHALDDALKRLVHDA